MPKLYGFEHITYLSIAVILFILTVMFIRKHVNSRLKECIFIKFIGILLLGSIIFNRISIALGRDNLRLLWPDSFCGTTSLVLSLSVIFLKRDNKILHYASYLGLWGGIVTLIYPDFIDQNESFLYPMTISGLMHHTLTVYLVIAMLITGYLKPTLKKWFILPIGVSIYMTYGLFLITVIGLDDAMYIYDPILEGTILNWFVLSSLFLPIHGFFLIIWELVNKKKGSETSYTI